MILNGAGTSSLSVDQQMLNVTKREGTVLKLECEITGNPKPIYNWYKDDMLIASANQVKHDNYTHRLKLQDVPFGGKLRLEPFLNTDAGWYRCVAENANGVRETSAYVDVNPDVLFRERYLQKQQRERNNPSSSSKHSSPTDSMSARIKSSAHQIPAMPSSIIDEHSVADVFGPEPANTPTRLGDGIFFNSPSSSSSEQQPIASSELSQMGHCEPYAGSICKDTIHGRPGAHVFVSQRSSQEQVERMLEAIITEINSQPGVIGADCAPYIAPMLCYHHLPPCAETTNHSSQQQEQDKLKQQIELRFQRRSQQNSYVPLEICQEDCLAVQTRHCRAEFNKMWSQQQSGAGMLIGDRPLVPDCSILRRSQDESSCVRFRSESVDQPRVHFGQSRIVSLSPNDGDIVTKSENDCYSGNGFSYRGKARRTKSGKTCASWASTEYSQMVGEDGQHNYCRNPAGDLPSPWCYTSVPFQRELCDIPKCELATRLLAQPQIPQIPQLTTHRQPITLSTPLTFSSLPVFLPIVAVPVLFCLIALLLLCMCRNRLARHCCRDKKHRRSRSSSNGSGSKMAPEQERCSSSQFYVGGFRSSASPGAGLFGHQNNFMVYGGLPNCSNVSTASNQVEPTFMAKGHQSIQMPTYPLAALRFFEQISDSTLARVFRGEITPAFCESGLPSSVMVKMLRSNDTSANSFNAEVEMLAGLQHPNIAHLVGVCFGPRPWCLLFECLSQDSLRQFLVNSIRQPYDDADPMYDDLTGRATSPFLRQQHNYPGASNLEHSDLLYIATQIAAALENMTGPQQQLVHRELSSHTIQIGDHLLVKVLPFSACRSGAVGSAILPSTLVAGAGSGPISSRGRLSSLSSNAPDNGSGSPAISPHAGRVAWLAPETILYGHQSAESDVWSFGIILWELFSYGCEPYSKASQMPGFDDRRIAELILGRSLLQRPTAASGIISAESADCPEFVYELMLECWDETPSRRPTFADIHARLLEWRSEGLFRQQRPASANHHHLGYDSNVFPMPPMPRMCSTSQQSASSTASSSQHHDAISASTHHTITSVGSGDAPQAVRLPPPVPVPLQHEESYMSVNSSNKDAIVNNAMYEMQTGLESENERLLVPVHIQQLSSFSTFSDQMAPLSRVQQQQVRRPSQTASPLLPPRSQHLGSFTTTFGGHFYASTNSSRENTGKRRLLVTANQQTETEAPTVATVTGRIGQTTAM